MNDTHLQDAAVGLDGPHVVPVVQRHVGDASFYWSQLDRAAHSPLLTLPGLLHFERLLTAHLEGVQVAGDVGWQMALQALQRWRGAGEAFVGTYLALNGVPAQAEHRWDEVFAVLADDPHRMLRGVMAALLRISPAISGPWLRRWIDPGQPAALQVAAWRALARGADGGGSLDAQTLRALWQGALASSHAPVRAAACRAAGRTGSTAPLVALLQDADRATAAEAAIALTAAQPTDAGLQALWRPTWAQAQELPQLKGAHRAQAANRLARWLRYLGVRMPHGHEAAPKLMQILPARMALSLLLHHGDSRHLPWVQTQMTNPECARWAGWVWAALLGIDLERSGLAHPPTRSEEAAHRPTDDLDPGLPMPNAEAVAGFDVGSVKAEARLSAQLASAQGCRLVLQNAPQALRWIAAQRLAQLTQQQERAALPFDTGADARVQIKRLAAMAR